MMLALRNWYMGRAERERWLIAAMIAIAIPLFLYLLIYAPIERALEAAKDRHVASVERNGRVKAQAGRLRAATSAESPAVGDLALLVGESAGRSGLVLTSAEARGSGVAIALRGASPTAVLRWLRELESQGAAVTELRMTPTPDGSLAVSAQLARGGRQ